MLKKGSTDKRDGGILVVPHVLWHGASVFNVKDLLSRNLQHKRVLETYSNPYIQNRIIEWK